MNNRTFILRLVAGAYVLYLGYQLLADYFKGITEGNAAVSIGGGVLFLIFGAWCVLSALVPLFKNGGFMPTGSEGTAEDSEEVAEDEDAEAADVDIEDTKVVEDFVSEEVSSDEE